LEDRFAIASANAFPKEKKETRGVKM
jgi:hypothetical protein